MDIQTNHRVILLNAKCDYVNKLYNVCKMSDYGDHNVDCCLEGMYAKSKLIDRLDCYCFPELITTTTTPAIYAGQIIASTTDYADGTILYMYINGVLASSNVVSSPDLSKQLAVYDLISNSGLTFEYHQVDINGSTTFDPLVIGYYVITMDCTANALLFSRQDGKGETPNNILVIESMSQEGVCEFTYSTCYNCIEDTDLPKMYEVLKKL